VGGEGGYCNEGLVQQGELVGMMMEEDRQWRRGRIERKG